MNVGDKVRFFRDDCGMETDYVYVVDRVEGSKIHVAGESYVQAVHDFKEVKVIEPAEVERASAILDGQQDDGWWLIPASSVEVSGSFIDADHTRALGLELRVQVRRVKS